MSNESKDSIASYLSRVMSPDSAQARKNKVRVNIAGEEFTIVASESDEYVRKVASTVDARIRSIMENSHISLSDASVLAACNIADEQLKAADTAENLRAQIKTYNDEISRLRMELNDLKRELIAGQKGETI